MTTGGAITMDDDTNGDPALPIGRAKAHIPAQDGDHIPEPQTVKPVTTTRRRIKQLDVIVASPDRVPAKPGAHNVSWHAMGDRDVQALPHSPVCPTPAGEQGNN